MLTCEKWIWLPETIYPDCQKTNLSGFADKEAGNYTVAEFLKAYTFKKVIRSVSLRFCGDTEYRLWCNDKAVSFGAVCVGGDFLGNDNVRPEFYSMQTELPMQTSSLCFRAIVRMMPVRICEYSKGHGGFMLTAHITFQDGTKTIVTTDESWSVRRLGAYTSPYTYDATVKASPYTNAAEIKNRWQTKTAPIPTRTMKKVLPENHCTVAVSAHEKKKWVAEFDKIYAGYLHCTVKTNGIVKLSIMCCETKSDGEVLCETLTFDTDGEYTGLGMHSVGELVVMCENASDTESVISIDLCSIFYPIYQVARTVTDDDTQNRVLEVCRHTLKYCRQTHHLDSPRHQEPLACTGDYYIETLMTAFSFGDLSLAEFDLLRTASLLLNNDGRMFHTSYSLIWVRMLYDVYMYTGKKSLLYSCEDALVMLLNRFETYIGANGLIETPPDYMFVDWIFIDGYSLHHPPKALGQTCLNMFYYMALDYAEKIFESLSEYGEAKECLYKKKTLRNAVNSLLFDAKKGLYFAGLNTATPTELLGEYMPQNTDKRYYLKHENILAAYVGICDKARAQQLIEKVMTDICPGEYQPYFAHFLLEAIAQNGLHEKYTRKVLEQWKQPVLDCPKGLVEGFIKPDSTYGFDHSHAWGGTPLYSLPKALSGIQINECGYKKITLSPSLIGFDFAKTEIPTPYGTITIIQEKGKNASITVPKEISYIAE